MRGLKLILKEAEKKKVAIGHFNVAEISVLKAVFEAAKDLGTPVIIGTSEGEAGFLGRKQAVALIKSLREEYCFPIFLNSDHTKSFEEVKKAVAAGYDAILFDGGTLPLAENTPLPISFSSASGASRAGAQNCSLNSAIFSSSSRSLTRSACGSKASASIRQTIRQRQLR